MSASKKILFFSAAAIIIAAGFFWIGSNKQKQVDQILPTDYSVSVAASSEEENKEPEKEVDRNEINNELPAINEVEIEKEEVSVKAPEEVVETMPSPINISVPFTTQAPLVKWNDPRQQDGCEEAVSVMVMAWVNNEGQKTKISAAEFEKRILALSDFQEKEYGEFRDTSLSDMEAWIFRDYFSYEKIELKTVATTSDIIRELEAGKIVLLPMAGRELKNPNFKAPGPLTHMILVKGYDYQKHEFITNDPGTRLGADYRYPAERIYNAIWVYPTGYHQETEERDRAMLIVER